MKPLSNVLRGLGVILLTIAIASFAGAAPPHRRPVPVPHYNKPTAYNRPVTYNKPISYNKPVAYNKPTSHFKPPPHHPVTTGPLIPKKPLIAGPHIPKKPVITGSHIPKKPTFFNPNYHIPGSQHWNGSQYGVFKNYHPYWHNQLWWKSHYSHIVLVSGGWYYWNSGYWYPAWGYAPNLYFAYDGPIYAGSAEVDPAQVVANVQSALQQQGFYQGAIDGVLGTDTSAALAAYQQGQGLETTGAIDQPTLQALGLA